jgi:hypothetical protein
MTKSRIFAFVFTLLLALHAYLMLATRLYPFIDVPNHMAAATILRYYHESVSFQHYFALRHLVGPNVLHLIFCSLPIFPSVEFANRLFFMFYVILLPVATLLVIRKLGGNVWFSLLSFLLLYDFTAHSGNVGFSIAIPLFLFFFYFTVNYLQRPTFGNGLAAAAMMLLIFAAHGMASQFAPGIFVLICLWQWRRNLRQFLFALWPALPLILINLIWWNFYNESNNGQSIFIFLRDYYRDEFFQDYWGRKMLLNLPNFHLLEGVLGTRLSQYFSLVIIATALFVAKSRWRTLRGQWADLRVASVLILLGASLAAYALLPDRIPDCLYVYQRFPVYIFLALILLGSLLNVGGIRWGKAALIILTCLFHFVLWSGNLRDFNQENADFTPGLFADIPAGSTLGGLMCDNKFRGWAAYRQFPNYYIIWNKEVVATRIVDYSFGYIRRNVSPEKLPKYAEWAVDDGTYDGINLNFNYYLVHGPVPDYVNDDLNRCRLVKSAGPWSIYEVNKPTQP